MSDTVDETFPRRRPGAESAEIRRLRRRIDALDRRIVRLMNERAALGREIGRAKVRDGRGAIRDVEREREVLLRVAMANDGPVPQADLLAIYRRLIAATRALERRDRTGAAGGGVKDGADARPPEGVDDAATRGAREPSRPSARTPRDRGR